MSSLREKEMQKVLFRPEGQRQSEELVPQSFQAFWTEETSRTPTITSEMSSLREKEMQKVLFRPEGQRLVEFIEIVELEQGRHFLCVSVPQSKEVQICVVRCQTKKSPKSGSKGCHTKRSRLEDSYKRTEVWSLQDLTQIDGRDPDIDDPCFLMHFDKARVVTAITCSAKYALVRTLVVLSDRYCQRKVKLMNFDLAYIKPTCNYTNRGDCVVLMQFCFYACNLVCLSMCPVPMD